MSVVNRRYEKLVLARVGPNAPAEVLAWCQGLDDATLAAGGAIKQERRKRFLAYGVVILLQAGWSLAWIRVALGNVAFCRLAEYERISGDKVPHERSERPGALQAIATWLEGCKRIERKRYWRYFACLQLRTSGWYLEWIGELIGHPKGHMPRLLRRIIAVLKHHCPALAEWKR